MMYVFLIFSSGQPLRSNAFLIPRWGGIAIKNPPKSASGRLEFSKEDLKPFMEIFVAQLRGLVGIHDLKKTMSSLVSFKLFLSYPMPWSIKLTSYPPPTGIFLWHFIGTYTPDGCHCDRNGCCGEAAYCRKRGEQHCNLEIPGEIGHGYTQYGCSWSHKDRGKWFKHTWVPLSFI